MSLRRYRRKASPGRPVGRPEDAYPTYSLVRDIANAEERGTIAAKGIHREVHVFAVIGILEDPAPIAAYSLQGLSCRRRLRSGSRPLLVVSVRDSAAKAFSILNRLTHELARS